MQMPFSDLNFHPYSQRSNREILEIWYQKCSVARNISQSRRRNGKLVYLSLEKMCRKKGFPLPFS